MQLYIHGQFIRVTIKKKKRKETHHTISGKGLNPVVYFEEEHLLCLILTTVYDALSQCVSKNKIVVVNVKFWFSKRAIILRIFC